MRNPDGGWAAQLELEPAGDGSRRRQRFYGRTRGEVLAKLDRARADLGLGLEPLTRTQARTTIGQLLDELDRHAAAGPSRRPLSELRAHQVAERQLRPYLGGLQVGKLDADHIEAWQDALLQAGYAPRTVWKARSSLAQVIRLARRKRPPLLRDNPLELVDPPPATASTTRALSGEEARRLLQVLDRHRLGTLVLCLLMLGLRRGEVLGLAWTDVDLEARTLTVRQQVQRVPHTPGLQLSAPKSRAGQRTLPLPSVLVERLRIDRERISSPLVFPSAAGTPIEPRNLYRAWAGICAAAGIEDLTLHELRHSAATVLQVLGVPPLVVAQLLGHADPAVTLRSYGHLVPSAHREAMDAMDAYVRGLVGPIVGPMDAASGSGNSPV